MHLGSRLTMRLDFGKLAAAGSTLLNGLVSYWPLNEVSGVRYDAVGSNDLTDNNTVGAVLRGPEGTVASFVAANSEYLSRASVSQSDEWTISLWAKSGDATAGFIHIAGAWPNENGALVGTLLSGAPTNFNANVMAGNGSAFASATYNVANGAGLWHHLVAWFDGDKAYLSVDGNTPVSTTSLGSIWQGSGTLYIGSQFPGVHQPVNGQVGEVAIWDRVLTSDERTALFAQGNGLHYADLPAGLLTGLVSWWELDEVSGVRYDSHGSNDLTDNNTVGSVINAGYAMDGAAASFVTANGESLSVATDLPPEFSFSFWLKRETVGGFPPIVGTDTRAFEAYFAGDDFYVGAIGDYQGVSGNVFPVGEWRHGLIVYDGANLKTYVNNVLVDTNTGWSLGAVNTLSLGGAPFATLSGQLDEVAIWDRALTADERAELYALGAGKYYPFA